MDFLKKTTKLIGFVLLLFTLEACKDSETASVEIFSHESPTRESMLSEAEIDYEMKSTYPGIQVSLRGYDAKGEKLAIFVGSTVPAAYEIKDYDTDETVFRGYVKRKTVENSDGYDTGIADFSDFLTEGKYYIKADILGRSKAFEITENLFEKESLLSYGMLKNIHCDSCHTAKVPFENSPDKYIDVAGGWHTSKEGEKDVVEGCLGVLDICTAYEYYPKRFSDNVIEGYKGNGIPDILDEAKYEAEWLLKMQNPETGGVYTKISLCDVSGKDTKTLMAGGETTRATAYFCACMAKFSMIMKKYDAEYAQRIFQAAVMSWNCLGDNRDIVDLDQMYRAAVEMYRATGGESYKTVIADYLAANGDRAFESRLALDGAITYLSTPRATDVDACTVLMANFMARTDAKAELAEGNRYSIESTDLSADELLRNIYELIVVDYIISSNAYVPLEKDYCAYLGGRNEISYDYINTLTTPDSIVKYLVVNAKLAYE